jgi:hypothetical protein
VNFQSSILPVAFRVAFSSLDLPEGEDGLIPKPEKCFLLKVISSLSETTVIFKCSENISI